MHHSPRPPSTHDTARPDTLHFPPTQPRTASRFFVSMRKSFGPQASPRWRDTENPRAAMYSTPEERHPYHTSRAGRSRYLDSRPTIEQIAMGLHVSRTPHLRLVSNPLQRHPLSSPSHRTINTPIPSCPTPSDNIHDSSTTSSQQHHIRRSLPPPPSRSSMKKSSPSSSTLAHPQQPFSSSDVAQSASTVTSAGLVTPGSSRPLSSLRARMSKFIPGYRPLSFPASFGRASSVTSSASDSTRPTTPRKAVRFSTSVLAIDEQSSS